MRELISGPKSQLELWELSRSGYVLVDAASQAMIEYSDDATSPLRGFEGQDATYLGPGEYVVAMPNGQAMNALNGAPREELSVNRIGEVTDQIGALAATADVYSLQNRSRVGITAVPPPVGTNVQFRIPSYGYITGCTVLHNTAAEGRCGWVAATIVMRYWHARSGKVLIPAAHRTGTNIKAVSGADFADLIRNGRSMASWGLPVADGIGYHALTRQKVASQAWYNWASTNVNSALNAGRPVILFGSLPDAYVNGKSIPHAVVAYGKSKDGHNIVHYTYAGKQAVVLNSGVVASNTHFMLR
ncbi:hypothetical protein FOJ82_12840 [Tessaracoccus rhinocerotis]|uniref:Peptidase C39-like domain-containing protein n=1 Tax=Tessaracoccus rhinocerotis TaxID=1689449 RepID=A0A553JY88_9ACTN|nr:hypothetical protein [Tessaracoccus rhinocerotis]TRY17416.1 hypothetical protein FOJ82_12840 [Tessaracoccus rhinocerotis]